MTGLRAFLAWWIVLFHFTRESIPSSWPISKSIVSNGYLAVDVFFVLSGYVMMRGYGETAFTWPAARRFYLRRFARIYPLYAASIAAGAFASPRRFLGDFGTEQGRIRLAMEVFLLNAWSHLAMFFYNFGAWSLSVEAFFYLLCPLLLPLVARLRPLGVLAALALAWLGTFVAPTIYTLLDPDHLGRPLRANEEIMGSWYLQYFPVQRLPEFIAGAAAARLPWKSRWAAPAGALGLLALLAADIVPFAYLRSGAALPLIVALVAGVAELRGGFLAFRTCVALGHASFATYILQWPLFMLWSKYDKTIWEDDARRLMYLPLLLLVSLAAHRCVEEPARQWLIRRFG